VVGPGGGRGEKGRPWHWSAGRPFWCDPVRRRPSTGHGSLHAGGNPVLHRPHDRAGWGRPCLSPAGRPTGGDPALRRPQVLRRRRLFLSSTVSAASSPSKRDPPPGKEEKKESQTAPPPAKPAAGNPVPLRRPTDPPATCPWQGSNPAPETWDRLPQTPPCLGGSPDHRGSQVPLKEPVGQPPVGLVRLGETREGVFCNSLLLQSPPVTIRPAGRMGCACERYPPHAWHAGRLVKWPARGCACGRYPLRYH